MESYIDGFLKIGGSMILYRGAGTARTWLNSLRITSFDFLDSGYFSGVAIYTILS